MLFQGDGDMLINLIVPLSDKVDIIELHHKTSLHFHSMVTNEVCKDVYSVFSKRFFLSKLVRTN